MIRIHVGDRRRRVKDAAPYRTMLLQIGDPVYLRAGLEPAPTKPSSPVGAAISRPARLNFVPLIINQIALKILLNDLLHSGYEFF